MSAEPTTAGTPDRAAEAGLRSFLSMLTLLGTVLGVGVINQMPGLLPTAFLTNARYAYAEALPEHWTFFATVADVSVMAYRVEPDGVTLLPALDRLGSAQSWFGMRRTADADVKETAYLLGEVPDAAWIPCHESIGNSCRHTAVGVTPTVIVDRFPHARLCGRLLIAIEGPVSSEAAQHIASATRPILKTVDVWSQCH